MHLSDYSCLDDMGKAITPCNLFRIFNLKKTVVRYLIALLIGYLSISMCLSDEIDAVGELKQRITERFHGMQITEITPSPVAGIYELVSGGQVYYVTEDANHLFNGALIDTRSRTDLTTARKGKVHLGLINKIEEKDMLIYESDTESHSTVTVFTDTSCPYCSRLHEEIDELLEAGIRVRYLLFPRAGLGSETHKELESVWCAEDPLAAMTTAKNGGHVQSSSCTNPIESHVALAESVGLRGTPLIYLDDGRAIPGYRTAKELIAMIAESGEQ